MKKLLFAALALLFGACTTDTTKDIAIEAPEILTVSFEEDSRVQLNEEQKTVWTAGDCVSVFYRSDAHDKYEFQGETGDTDGTLKRVKRGTPSIGLDKVVAVYPYNDEYLIELQTGNIQAFLPDTQHYQKDSFGIGSSIMISSSRSDRLHLKNVCGWLKLQLTGEDVVKSIKLKGNNGEQLAGNIFITADDATCTLAADLNEKYGDESGDLSGSLVDATTILTEITLDCGDGVTLTAEPTTFYIALPPQTFSKGITVDIECKYNNTIIKSTNNSITISRNTIQPMDSIKAGLVPYNEIWYTSADGNIITPNKTGVFGAKIVSNTYENGAGIITFDGPVTKIGNYAFSGCSSLTSVTIPDSVTSIGESAFSGCSSLTSVTIPNSVTSIGFWAFYNCSSLASVTIGNSVTTLGTNPFERCSKLAEFNGKFASTDKRCLIMDGKLNSFAPAGLVEYNIPDSVTSIGIEAFRNCRSLTTVTIPNSVTSIGNSAFNGCSSLASITIPDSVTLIEGYTFSSCNSLTTITIPDSVTSIGYGAFKYCRSLTTVTIPNSVTSIERETFEGCSSLTSVTIPDSVTSIGYGAFSSCGSLASVTIGNRVTSIGESAFSGCSSLTSIIIPDSVTSIGESAFSSCDKLAEFNGKFASTDKHCLIVDVVLNSFAIGCGLTEYTIPNSVTSIGSSAFSGCSNLASVTIGNCVTSIGESAFTSCNSLTSVTIPDSVTSIGISAFEGCSILKDVYCNAAYPPTLGNNVFSNTALENIYVYAESVDTYKAKWSSYADKVVTNGKNNSDTTTFTYTTTDGNPIYVSNVAFLIKSNTYTDGVGKLVIYGKNISIPRRSFYRCNTLQTINIPEGVTSIGYEAFYDCGSLTSVTIPNSVTLIGNRAFRYCSGLTSITIGNSVTSIGDYAFDNCSSLASVTIPNSVTSIGDGAFLYCSGLTSVTIGNSVTSIGDYAFGSCDNLTEFNSKLASADKRCLIVDGVLNSFAIGCGVTEYTIPDSVTSIGDYAFYGCSSLTSVTIPDSVTSIGYYAFRYCSSLKNVYCKPTTPPVADFEGYSTWDAFNSNASGRKIYVPRASESAYEEANGWSSYAADIEPYDF